MSSPVRAELNQSSALETSLAGLASPFLSRARFSSSGELRGGSGRAVTAEDAFLTMGDLVALFSGEGGGYLVSEGFTDSTCSLRGVNPGSSAPRDFGEAVFELLPRFRYESRTALARYQETQSMVVGEDDETLAALQKDLIDEDQDNSEESQRWYGVRVRYGQVIQLRHRQSGKFLGVTVKEQAKVEKQNLRVVLDDGSEECRWIFAPRYKVRSEGEEIHSRDQMLLLNSKYHFYLHVSASSSGNMGRREVNASNDFSTWTISMFAPFTSGVSPHALRVGDVIQIFHREQERFLTKAVSKQGVESLGTAAPFSSNAAHGGAGDEDPVVLTVPDQISKGKVICHNSNSFWSVEFENPLVGGVCTFGGVFRFRHVATGLYLAGSNVVEKKLTFLDVGNKSSFRVNAVHDSTHPDTLWTISSLNPSDRPGNAVLQESFFVLRHKSSSVYLGAGEVESAKDEKSPASLVGIKNDDEGNAFVFRAVPPQDVSMLHDVVGKVRFLSQFIRYQLHKQQESAKLRKKQRGNTANARTLIRDNSFSGATVNVLSKGLIEMLNSLIVSLESSSEESLLVRARQNLLRHQNALFLLTRVLELVFDKETGIPLEELHKAENFTIHTIVKLIYRLLELLLRDNPENQVLLSRKSFFIQSHIGTIEEAQGTLMLLFKNNPTLLHNITEKQMDFFLDLIRTKGKESGFIRFLPVLCSIKDIPLSSNQLYLAGKFLSQDAGLFPKFQHSEGSSEVSISLPEFGEGKWVKLEDLVSECSPLLNDYIIGSIDLLAWMCMGRNSAVIQTVAQRVPLALIMSALRLPRLHAGMRAAFANVLLHTYVDVDPQKRRPMVSFTRVWLHLDKSLVTTSFNDEFSSVKKLAQLFLEFVNEKDAGFMHGFSLLLYRMLDLVLRMFEFGLYQEMSELQDLVPHLSRVLGLRTQSRALMRATRDSDFMLIEAKLKACRILDCILQYRLDAQITKLLVILKEQLEVRVTQQVEHVVESVLARLSFETEEHMNKILSLFHYDYPPLSTLASNLLIRHNTQRAVLVEAFKQVQVLVSDESVKTYELVQKLVESLRVLIAGDIDDDMVPEILDILKQWIKLCIHAEHRSENQRILFNLNAHSVVISLCQNPFQDIGVEEENQINTYSFHFLMQLCKGNAKIQTELFQYFDFFSKYLDRVPRVAELLTEVLRDNARNLMIISERQIQYLVNFVALGHRQARFLETLSVCCTLNKAPVRRNQVMVMRLMLEQGKQTLVLFNDPESKSERNMMIRAGEYRDPHHVINYHIALLELLTTCCQGRIYEAEIKAQSLYSLSEIVDQLADPSNLWAIKGRIIDFLSEVYFEAERISESVEFQASLWEIFSLILAAFEMYPELDEDLRKDDGYRYFIFEAVLPFFKVFFNGHYDHARATQSHQLIVSRLAAALVNWLALDLLDLNDGKLVCSTVSDLLKHLQVNASAALSLGGASGTVRLGLGTPLRRRKTGNPSTSAGPVVNSGSGGLDQRKSPGTSSSAVGNSNSPPSSSVTASGGEEEKRPLLSTEQMLLIVERWRKQHEVSASVTGSTTLSGSLQAFDGSTQDEGIHGEMRSYAKLLKQGMDLPGEMQHFAEILQTQMTTGIAATVISIMSSNMVSDDQSLVLRGLRGMRLILESHEVEREQLQNQFNDLRATQMMLELLNRDDEVVQLEALNFGIALLFGGNAQVQQSILDHFTKTADDEWFHNFRRLIRRVSENVKSLYERQIVLVGGHDGEGVRQRKELKFKCEMLERIFRFLQLLCEGHFSGLQHFLRAQSNNAKSYDLVTETVETLEVLERCIDDHTVAAMKQMWISLTEYVQGPCSENQNVLIATKMCESANFLLQDELSGVSDPNDRRDLKEEVLLTLLSVLEGQANPQVAIHLLRSLDFGMMRDNLARLWSESLQHEEKTAEMGTLGFRYYALLITLRDFEQDNRLSPVTKIESVNGFSQMARLIGRIEIVRHERLERVYFPIPEICKSIPERDKKHILWSVERTTQQQKIESFFKLSDQVISELKHLDEVRKEPVFSLLNERHTMLQSASFWMALLINLVIVLSYHAPRGSKFQESELTISLWMSILLFLMGLVQVFFAGLLLVTVLVGSWKLLVIRGWDQDGVQVDWKEVLADRHKLLRSAYFVFRDTNVLYRSFYLFFAVLGVTVPNGYFFFATHLFDVVVRNDILKSVLKSISFNWKQLVMTASFTSIIVYCYSIVGFLFFRKAFFINEDTLDCETMLQCTVMMLYKGLRNGGGIGDVLVPPVWEDSLTVWRIIYDATFWVVCILILLNSFLGIIIDTFGELRSKDQAILEDIESKCFVCGVDRHRFDRLTAGFDVHIKYDHNMWHYLYFNVHLKRTEETEYTGPESFVDEMLTDRDLSFIPNQRAMCLESTREKGTTSQLALDLEIIRGQSDESIKDMEMRFSIMQEQFQEKLMMFSEQNMAQISSLISKQNSVVENRLSMFDSRLARLEQVMERLLTAAPLIKSPTVSSPRTGGSSNSRPSMSGSQKASSSAAGGASGKPSAAVLSKYTQGSALIESTASDSSDDEILSVLKKDKKKQVASRETWSKASEEKNPSSVSSSSSSVKKPESGVASGAPPAELMARYTKPTAAAAISSDDDGSSSDDVLAALKSKKTASISDHKNVDDKKTDASSGKADVGGAPSAEQLSKYQSYRKEFSDGDTDSDDDGNLLAALKPKKESVQAALASADASQSALANSPPSTSLMSKYSKASAVSQSSDSDSDDVLAALKPKKSAVPVGASEDPPADLKAKYGQVPSHVVGSDDDSDDALAALKSKNAKNVSASGNSDSEELHGVLRSPTTSTSPSLRALSRSAVSSLVFLSPSMRDNVTPEASDDELSLDPDREVEEDQAVPDWNYKQELSDDDLVGSGSGSASASDDDEEKKRALAQYMSKGSGLYKTAHQLL